MLESKTEDCWLKVGRSPSATIMISELFPHREPIVSRTLSVRASCVS